VPKTSRQIALEILSQAEREGVLAEKGFARLNALTLEPKEKALAAELVKGTLRWRGRIDYLLSHLSRRPLASLPVYLRNTLRLGAYQILFLDRVPHWAAVDESVKLARRHGHEGQVKYVNAVLRNLIRTGDQIPLPDPSRPAAHLAVVHAFPEWLASRWIKRFGAPEAARLMASCNIPAPLTLRVNRLKISPERFMTILAEVTRREDALVVPESALALDREGMFVWRVGSDDTAERVSVETGYRAQGRVEIAGGLEPGDRIVAAGTNKVRAGSVVRAAAPTSDAGPARATGGASRADASEGDGEGS